MTHTSKPAFRAAAALSLIFSLSAPPIIAQDQPPMPALEVMRERLNLTAEQEAQIAPLLVRRKGELQETRTRLTNLDSRSEKRSVMKNVKMEQDLFNSQVEAVLSPEQKTEWAKLRAQTREALKKYWNQ